MMTFKGVKYFLKATLRSNHALINEWKLSMLILVILILLLFSRFMWLKYNIITTSLILDSLYAPDNIWSVWHFVRFRKLKTLRQVTYFGTLFLFIVVSVLLSYLFSGRTLRPEPNKTHIKLSPQLSVLPQLCEPEATPFTDWQ